MIFIGEKLNSSIPSTSEIFKNNNREGVRELIKNQADAGADYIDINTAIMGEKELDTLLWVMDEVYSTTDCKVMIDSVDVNVIAAALERAAKGKVGVNSVTVSERLEEIVPLCVEKDATVILLPITSTAMPDNTDDFLSNAKIGIEKICNIGLPMKNIFLDVLTRAVATDDTAGIRCLEFISAAKESLPDVKTTCGLSNISFGLPRRSAINSAFATLAVVKGLDSAILDVNSQKVMDSIYSASVISGEDSYCMDFISYVRGL